MPKLLVLNLEDTKSEKSVYRFMVNEKEKSLTIDLRWHLKGTFHEQMELQDFPFDVQVSCSFICRGSFVGEKERGCVC